MEDKLNIKFGLLPETSAAIQKSLESYHDSLAGLKQMVEEFRKRPLIDFPPNFKGIANLVIFGTDSLREFLELNPDHFRKLDEKHNEVEVKTKETFRVLKTEYISYLEKNGYIIPDEKNFFRWYFFVKYGDAPFTIPALEKMSNVTAADLKEYHDYKVGQFHQVEQTLEIGKPTRERILPDFRDALKEPKKLPKLWKRLSKMKQPFVSERGTFILAGRPHAILFAFARALKNRDRLHETITIDDAYQILCVHFDVIPSPSLRQVKRGKRDVIDNFEAFNDILSEDE